MSDTPKIQEYRVTAPDGHVIVLSGPAGASDEEVLKQAQTLYQPTNANAEPYQSPVYPGGPESRTAGEVMQDQAANVLTGIPQAVTGIPGAVAEVGGSLWDMIRGKGTARAQNMLKGTVQPAAPIVATLAGNPPSPESPEWAQAAQGAGAVLGTAALGAGVKAAAPVVSSAESFVRSKIPSTASAGAKFQTVLGAAKDVPVDLSETAPIVERAREISTHGGPSMPKVLRDFIKNRAAADITPTADYQPMTYETGRDFATNAGSQSTKAINSQNAAMQRQVGQFADAMKTANREAAAKVGMGDIYDQAMKEYRQAKTIEDAKAIVKKHAIRGILGAGGLYLLEKEIEKYFGH